MESLTSVLPNLGVGVVSVIAVGWVTREFLRHLQDASERHEKAMNKREEAFREVESGIRGMLLEQVGKNTSMMADVVKVLGRVEARLDSE